MKTIKLSSLNYTPIPRDASEHVAISYHLGKVVTVKTVNLRTSETNYEIFSGEDGREELFEKYPTVAATSQWIADLQNWLHG